MTRRRLGLWLAAAALALRAAVGPSMPAGMGLGEQALLGAVCSASDRSAERLADDSGDPQAPLQRQLHAHCAECIGCAAMPALLPAVFALPQAPSGPSVAAPAPAGIDILARAALRPPPRGPPPNPRSV